MRLGREFPVLSELVALGIAYRDQVYLNKLVLQLPGHIRGLKCHGEHAVRNDQDGTHRILASSLPEQNIGLVKPLRHGMQDIC